MYSGSCLQFINPISSYWLYLLGVGSSCVAPICVMVSCLLMCRKDMIACLRSLLHCCQWLAHKQSSCNLSSTMISFTMMLHDDCHHHAPRWLPSPFNALLSWLVSSGWFCLCLIAHCVFLCVGLYRLEPLIVLLCYLTPADITRISYRLNGRVFAWHVFSIAWLMLLFVWLVILSDLYMHIY